MGIFSEKVGRSTTVTIGLADGDGKPHGEARRASLLAAIEGALSSSTVFFQGVGTGSYTNEAGVTYTEPTVCIVGSLQPGALEALVDIVRRDGQEALACTDGVTYLMS